MKLAVCCVHPRGWFIFACAWFLLVTMFTGWSNAQGFEQPVSINLESNQEGGDDQSSWIPLFNGKDLSGWQRVNTAASTWSVRDGMLICSGKPIGELRTKKMYQNFELEVEWRHMKPKGNAGIFVWADDITAKGVPFHRSIEVQVLENAYGNTRGYTTHGDIFPIHGAKMVPVNGRGGNRAFPIENRSKPSPEWNHYRIVCLDGTVSLAVNGKVVTRGKECSPRKGYICIESEGGVVHYRNMRIKELPDSKIDPGQIAIKDRGYRCIYDGIDLKPFDATDGWRSSDWQLVHQGEKAGQLVTRSSFGDSDWIIDFKSGNESLEFEFRGQKIRPSTWPQQYLAKGQGWNRMEVSIEEGLMTISVNQQVVQERLKLADTESPLTVTVTGPAGLSNLYVK